MSGRLGRNLHRNERLNDIVGPEQMQYLQPDHHKHHEPSGRPQHTVLKLTISHMFLKQEQVVVDGRIDADCHKKDDSAPHP